MTNFNYQNNELFAESVSITDLATTYQTPLYIYSQSAIEANYLEFDSAFADKPHLICYAVKANSNLAVLNALARLGAGFDIVSMGELHRVLAAEGDASKCVFSGVAKNYQEIEFALHAGIQCFNVESSDELELIAKVAKEVNIVANISIRVNPNVDAKTHPYISTGLSENKFGIDITIVDELYYEANENPYLNVVGVDCHIGSQITEKTPFIDALDKVLILVTRLKERGIEIEHIDLGGGVGIDYENNATINIAEYVTDILSKVGDLKVILEPGRAIVGNAGVFVTQVQFLKQNQDKNFAIVDGGMNDLLRPSLYQAFHNVQPVKKQGDGICAKWDIVGPVCETGDYFAKERELCVQQDDLLAVMDAGAYGFVMASNYNTRPFVAEVMVKGDKHQEIRKRQTIQELFETESKHAIN